MQIAPITQRKTFTAKDLIISNDSLRTPYERRTGEEKLNIHWGQRKLLLSEIEFFSIYWDPVITPNPVCVYAGAAPGNHIPLLSTMFPSFTFHLYDPAEFKIEATNKIILHQEYFTNEIAKSYSNRNDVFFLSDIRTADYKTIYHDSLAKRGITEFNDDGSAIGPPEVLKEAYAESQIINEDQIWGDHLMQQAWVFDMNPLHSYLKFRLPYVLSDKNTIVQYLKGIVYWQVWCPQTSTETRLKPVRNSDGQYEIADWDNLEYEQWAFHHNVIDREKTLFTNPFTDTNDPIDFPELLNDYDSVAEAFILKLYFEKIGVKQNIYDQVKRMSKLITLSLNRYNMEKKNTTCLASKRASTVKSSSKIAKDAFRFRQTGKLPQHTAFKHTKLDVNPSWRSNLVSSTGNPNLLLNNDSCNVPDALTLSNKTPIINNKPVDRLPVTPVIGNTTLPSLPTITPPTVKSPAITPPSITRPTITPPTATRPTITPPTVKSPAITPPSITRPTITPPTATRPTITPPTATRPTITPPTATLPSITRPIITPPTATLPSITPPTATLPSITPPTATLPSITPPTATLPTITPPTITPPTITPPTATLPTITPPTITPPTATLPTITPPTITPPTATLPTITPPTATLPSITPPVSVPKANIPQVQPVSLSTPSISVPTISKPQVAGSIPIVSIPSSGVSVPRPSVPSPIAPLQSISVPRLGVPSPSVSVPRPSVPSPIAPLQSISVPRPGVPSPSVSVPQPKPSVPSPLNQQPVNVPRPNIPVASVFPILNTGIPSPNTSIGTRVVPFGQTTTTGGVIPAVAFTRTRNYQEDKSNDDKVNDDIQQQQPIVQPRFVPPPPVVVPLAPGYQPSVQRNI